MHHLYTWNFNSIYVVKAVVYKCIVYEYKYVKLCAPSGLVKVICNTEETDANKCYLL